MTEFPLDLSAQFERTQAWYRGDSVRHLVIELKAPPSPLDQEEPQQAISLALVLDNSGSMCGEPLEAAKSTALAVVEQLGAQDFLTVVTFSMEAELILEPCLMDSEGKQKARLQILQIQSQGSTNLSGGWFEGARQLSQLMDELDQHLHHLILLSDGYANQGILKLDTMRHHVAEIHERGLSTSCVGFGNDYEVEWLETIASAGGGRLHDAEHPEEIALVLLGEIGEVRSTLMEQIRVQVQLPPGASAQLLERYPTAVQSNEVEVLVGALSGDAQAILVLQVTLPAGPVGTELPFRVQAHYQSTLTKTPQSSAVAEASIQLVHGPTNNEQPRHPSRALLVARHWQAQVLHRCMQLNRDRAYQQATEYAENQLKYLKRFCKGIPRTEGLVQQMESLSSRIGFEIGERSRKNIQMDSIMDMQCRIDFRPNRRKLNLDDELQPNPSGQSQDDPKPSPFGNSKIGAVRKRAVRTAKS